MTTSTSYATGERRELLRRQAVEKHQHGKPIRAIAKELNYSYGAIYVLLKQSGVAMRDRGYRSEP